MCWHVPIHHPGHVAKQYNRGTRRTVHGHSAHQAARMPLPPSLASLAPFPIAIAQRAARALDYPRVARVKSSTCSLVHISSHPSP